MAPPAEDETMKAVWERVLLNRRTGGWVLVIVGAVGVLHIFSEPLNQLSAQWLKVLVPVTGLVIPVVLLLLGIVLLQKSRKGN